jgi:hypothetical protein
MSSELCTVIIVSNYILFVFLFMHILNPIYICRYVYIYSFIRYFLFLYTINVSNSFFSCF